MVQKVMREPNVYIYVICYCDLEVLPELSLNVVLRTFKEVNYAFVLYQKLYTTG